MLPKTRLMLRQELKNFKKEIVEKKETAVRRARKNYPEEILHVPVKVGKGNSRVTVVLWLRWFMIYREKTQL